MEHCEAVERGGQIGKCQVDVAQPNILGVSSACLVLAGDAQGLLEELGHHHHGVPVLLSLAAVALASEVLGLHPEPVGGPDPPSLTPFGWYARPQSARRAAPHFVRRRIHADVSYPTSREGDAKGVWLKACSRTR